MRNIRPIDWIPAQSDSIMPGTLHILDQTLLPNETRFVDTTGQLIEEGQAPQIYGGSTLKLAGSLYCYNSGGAGIGISLQLSGVQIIDLAPPKSIQFEAEEGGFVAANDNGGSDDSDGEVQYNF